MKFKLDENLGRRSDEHFREAGHEVSTVLDEGLGASTDENLLEACRSEGRALVTLDLDLSNVLKYVWAGMQPSSAGDTMLVVKPGERWR